MPLIVFDLDGTLIDSRVDLANAANALIEELGGAPQPVEAITGMVGEGARLLVRRALAAAGLAADEEAALARFLELYDERLLVHTAMYPGTRDLLDRLAADTQLAVLTNKPQHHTDRILDGLGIARYFAHVVGGDTPLGRKPDPAGLRHLIALTGTPDAESVMVGDSAIDLRTARAAGIRICLVRYGFGFPLAAREMAGDELVADAPVNVADLIRGRASARQRS
jgi:phosphoglycolate phosphatase